MYLKLLKCIKFMIFPKVRQKEFDRKFQCLKNYKTAEDLSFFANNRSHGFSFGQD